MTFDAEPLKATPYEYFDRQCFIACDADEPGIKFCIEHVGDENIVFNTDYPHADAPDPVGAGAQHDEPAYIRRLEAEDNVGQLNPSLRPPPAGGLQRRLNPVCLKRVGAGRMGSSSPLLLLSEICCVRFEYWPRKRP